MAWKLPRCLPLCALLISWDPNSEPDLAGYNLFWGTGDASSATNKLPVGNVSSITFQEEPGQSYAFTVTAYNSWGLESDPCEVVFWRPPARLEIALTPARDGVILRGRGQRHHDYSILASDDMVSWVEIYAVVSDETGRFEFYDGDFGGWRFYRAASRLNPEG